MCVFDTFSWRSYNEHKADDCDEGNEALAEAN
jgi:hypothetical protein